MKCVDYVFGGCFDLLYEGSAPTAMARMRMGRSLTGDHRDVLSAELGWCLWRGSVVKILFTADLHSNEEAFRQFVRILDTNAYDCGVIAGDLTEGNVTKEEAIELLGITEDDLLPELSFVDETCVEAMERQIRELYKSNSYYMRVLRVEEQRLKEILTGTKKPILIVKGNHDKTPWESERNVYNIHLKKVRFKGHSFVGYCHTDFDKWDKDMAIELEKIKHHIEHRTIFITHAPAYGVLDQRYSDRCSTGSRAIAKLVSERKPYLHLHGHVHDEYGCSGRTINGAFIKSRCLFEIDIDRNAVRKIVE